MITMLLGGLRHGASWTFVVWGGIHGFCLVIERGAKRLDGGRPPVDGLAAKVVLGLLTYFLVNLTWVFFRAKSFSSAGLLLASMFGLPAKGAQVLPTLEILKVAVVIPVLLIFQWAFRSKRTEEAAESVPWWMHGLAWVAMIVLLVLTQGTDNAFIYFQF